MKGVQDVFWLSACLVNGVVSHLIECVAVGVAVEGFSVDAFGICFVGM